MSFFHNCVCSDLLAPNLKCKILVFLSTIGLKNYRDQNLYQLFIMLLSQRMDRYTWPRLKIKRNTVFLRRPSAEYQIYCSVQRENELQSHELSLWREIGVIVYMSQIIILKNEMNPGNQNIKWLKTV